MARICVGALVTERDGDVRILLGQRAADRAFYPGVWDIPGGHCARGETLEQALVRELQEEVGVTPTAWRRLSTLRRKLPGRDERLVLHVYAVTDWTGKPQNRLPEEHADVAWFGIDEACRLPLAHADYPALFRRLAMTS